MLVFLAVLCLTVLILYLNRDKFKTINGFTGYVPVDNHDLCENPDNHNISNIYFDGDGNMQSEVIKGRDRRNVTKCRVEKCNRVKKCTDLRKGLDNETVNYCGTCFINNDGEYNKHYYSNKRLETIRDNMINNGMLPDSEGQGTGEGEGLDPHFNCITDKTFNLNGKTFKNWLPPSLFTPQSKPELACDNRTIEQVNVLGNKYIPQSSAPADLGEAGKNCYRLKEVHDYLSEGNDSAKNLANNIKNTVGWCGDQLSGNHGKHVIIDTDPVTGKQIGENNQLKLKSGSTQQCTAGKIWDMDTCRVALGTNPCLGDQNNPSFQCVQMLWENGGINITEDGSSPSDNKCTTKYLDIVKNNEQNKNSFLKIINSKTLPTTLKEIKTEFKKFMTYVVNEKEDTQYSRVGNDGEVLGARELCNKIKLHNGGFTTMEGFGNVKEGFLEPGFADKMINKVKKAAKSLVDTATGANSGEIGEKDITEVDPCRDIYDNDPDLPNEKRVDYYSDCAMQTFTNKKSNNKCTTQGNVWHRLKGEEGKRLSWGELHGMFNLDVPENYDSGNFEVWKDEVSGTGIQMTKIIEGTSDTVEYNYLIEKAHYDCLNKNQKIAVLKDGYIKNNIGKYPDLTPRDITDSIVPQKGHMVQVILGDDYLKGMISSSNIETRTVKIFITETRIGGAVKTRDNKSTYEKNGDDKSQEYFGWPEMDGTVFKENLNSMSPYIPWNKLILVSRCKNSDCCGKSCLELYTSEIAKYPPMPNHCVYNNFWNYSDKQFIDGDKNNLSTEHSQGYYLFEKKPRQESLDKESKGELDGDGCFKKQLRVYQPPKNQGDKFHPSIKITQKTLERANNKGITYDIGSVELDGLANHIFGKTNQYIPERISSANNKLGDTVFIPNNSIVEGFKEGNTNSLPKNASSCSGWTCDIEQQYCPPGLTGSTDKGGEGYCCRNKAWVEGKCDDTTKYKLMERRSCSSMGKMEVLGDAAGPADCAQKCHNKKVQSQDPEEVCCQWDGNKCKYTKEPIIDIAGVIGNENSYASMLLGTGIAKFSDNYEIKTMRFYDMASEGIYGGNAIEVRNKAGRFIGEKTDYGSLVNLVWHYWPGTSKKHYPTLYIRNTAGIGVVDGRISTKYYSGSNCDLDKTEYGSNRCIKKGKNLKTFSKGYYCALNPRVKCGSPKYINNIPRGELRGDFLSKTPGSLIRLSYKNNRNGSNALNTFKIFKGDNGEVGAAKRGLDWKARDFLVEVRQNGKKVDKNKFMVDDYTFKNIDNNNKYKIEFFFKPDEFDGHWGIKNIKPHGRKLYVSINALEFDFLVKK